MRHVTVLERGRIERAPELAVDAPDGDLGTPSRRRLPAVLFERLFRQEGNLEDRGEAPVFTWGRGRATVGPWVGVLQLPGLSLELLPKTEDREVVGAKDEKDLRARLLEMLSVAGFGRVRDRGMARLELQAGRVHDGLVARFLTSLAVELSRGLDRTYLGEEDNLGVLRGRLVLGRHLARNAAARHRFYCRFESLAEETNLNRVLRAACDELGRWPLSVPIARQAADLRAVFADVSPWPRGVEPPVIHWTRQNDRFEDLYAFATMILAARTPGVRAGDTATFSLLFHMDRVFEGYIAKFLQRYVVRRIEGLRLREQAKGDRRHLFTMAGPGSKLLELRPDLLFEHTPSGATGTTRMIIDTKWKRLDGDKKGRPSNNDLYQLYAYASRYACRRVALLYPRVDGVDSALFQAHGSGEVDVGEVSTRFVNLSRPIETEKGRGDLADELEDILRAELALPPAERHAAVAS